MRKGNVTGIKAKSVTILQFPVLIKKDESWFIAICPFFKLATQGRSMEEARENMKDLIQEYLKDPDTPKPNLKKLIEEMASITFSSIPLKIRGDIIAKTKAVAKA